MSVERFSLEEINNMSAETMRQILREQTISSMRAEREAEQAKAEEAAKKEAEQKEFDEYFNTKFANQHPKFHDQY